MRALLLLILAATATPAFAADLFYLEQKKNGCHWLTRRGGAVAKHHLTPTCPEPGDVLFDSTAERTVYARAGKLFEKRWGGKVSPLPAPPERGNLFVSKRTGALRVAYLVPVPEQGDPEFDPTGLPEWGTPYFAVVAELAPAGQWKRVARASTKSEAGETPGLSVVQEQLEARPGSSSLSDLLFAATCAESDCSAEAQGLKPPKERLASLELGEGDELGHRGGFLFKITYGDSPHAAPPVVHLRSGRVLVPPAHHDQLSLSVGEGQLLLTGEYDGSHPRLYSTDGELLFEAPRATGAAWLPFPL